MPPPPADLVFAQAWHLLGQRNMRLGIIFVEGSWICRRLVRHNDFGHLRLSSQIFLVQVSKFYSAGFAMSPKKPCSAATTCAPSPMAPPTRLTEPERTSPTANTPGTEVSSCGTRRP